MRTNTWMNRGEWGLITVNDRSNSSIIRTVYCTWFLSTGQKLQYTIANHLNCVKGWIPSKTSPTHSPEQSTWLNLTNSAHLNARPWNCMYPYSRFEAAFLRIKIQDLTLQNGPGPTCSWMHIPVGTRFIWTTTTCNVHRDVPSYKWNEPNEPQLPFSAQTWQWKTPQKKWRSSWMFCMEHLPSGRWPKLPRLTPEGKSGFPKS